MLNEFDVQRAKTLRKEFLIKYEMVSSHHALTLWTPEVGIPTLRKLPYAARRRYTVGTVCYRTRQKSVYLRHGV